MATGWSTEFDIKYVCVCVRACSSKLAVIQRQVWRVLHRKLRPRRSCSRPRYSRSDMTSERNAHPQSAGVEQLHFESGFYILFQLALKGPPGAMGLRGRPGPLVRDVTLFCHFRRRGVTTLLGFASFLMTKTNILPI